MHALLKKLDSFGNNQPSVISKERSCQTQRSTRPTIIAMMEANCF